MKRAIAILLVIISLITIFPITAFGGVTNSSGNKVSSISLTTKRTGSESVKSYTLKYTNADFINDSYAGVVIPVKASNSGRLFIDYKIKTLGANVTVELYKESSLQTCVDYEYLDASELEGELEFKVPKNGTYYLAFYSYSSEYSDPYKVNVTLKPYIIGDKSRTMTEDTWSYAYSYGEKTYFKFTLSKTRIVTIYSGSYDVSVTLTNSKKKALQDYSTYLDKDNNYRTSYTLNKGTYYICTTGNYDVYKLKYKTSAIPTLTASEYKKFYQANGELNMYVKFKATASGYVTIKGKNFSGYVTLCNENREAISSKVYMYSKDGDTAVFGVTKGKTYYLRLNNNNDYGSIRFTNTKITDNSGSKKSKAKSMKIGDTYKGYIAAGSETKDWYKFNLSSSKYFSLDIDGAVCDAFKVTIYDKDGKELRTLTYYGDKAQIYTYNKVKGTFYVRVSRANKKSSGYYSLKVRTSSKKCLG